MKWRFGFIFMMIFACAFTTAHAQQKVSWETLAQVKYFKEYDSYFGFEVNTKPPEYDQEILDLVGKEIIISGHMIPVDIENNKYVISANPYASCFFCGGAGPESVMEIVPKNDIPRFDTDEVVTFKGTFNINDESMMGLDYQLKNAVMVEK